MGESAEISGERGYDSYTVTLGDLMRGERATLGKSLLDVERDLRIKAAYISAIENSDPTVFQTAGFIAGHVRSYARYLGLDPDRAFTQFCEEAGFAGVNETARSQKNPKRVSMREIRVNAAPGLSIDPLSDRHAPFARAGVGVIGHMSVGALGSVLVLLILILGIGYGFWAVLQDIQRVDFETTDGAASEIAALPADTISDEPFSEMPDSVAEAPVDNLYRLQALDVPVLTPRDGPISMLDPDTVGALAPRLGGDGEGDTDRETGSPAVSKPGTPVVRIFASNPAWVRVSQGDGSVLFEKILDKGEVYVLPAGTEAPILRAGNAGSVFLSVGGTIFGPVGTNTAVVKNVDLAATSIADVFARIDDTDQLREIGSPKIVTENLD